MAEINQRRFFRKPTGRGCYDGGDFSQSKLLDIIGPRYEQPIRFDEGLLYLLEMLDHRIMTWGLWINMISQRHTFFPEKSF
jgi:hypothetical protein